MECILSVNIVMQYHNIYGNFGWAHGTEHLRSEYGT